MMRFGVVLGVALLLISANAPLALANNAKNGVWIASDDCGSAMALRLTNIGGSVLYTTDDNKSWFVLSGDIASAQDKLNGDYHEDRVFVVDGVKLKSAVKYFPESDTLLVTPVTDSGHKKLAELLTGDGKTTIKYGLHTITASYPSIEEGRKAIANCKPPI